MELPVFTRGHRPRHLVRPSWPSVLAVLLPSACFDYFFTEPYYSFDMTSKDIAHFLVFDIWAAIVVSFFVVRRRTEADLRQVRNNLQLEVDQRRRREDEIRKLNQELGARAAELEAINIELEC